MILAPFLLGAIEPRYGGIYVYRLLIVTSNPKVEEMFAAMDGWEAIGYKPPRLRRSVEEAEECLQRHHIHAIAVENHAAFEPLMTYLDENYPTIPFFSIEEDADAQLATLKDVYRLLSQVHADHTNDDYDEAYYFNLARERWMKKLISGMAPTREYILAHHRMLRCKESPEVHCLYARLAVPYGDEFLMGRWHYGSDRLEMALRNFFGEEKDNMAVHVAVISPEEVRVMVCPKTVEAEADMSAERVLGYIEETIEQIEQYLGLSMNILDIRQMDNLIAFATEQQN